VAQSPGRDNDQFETGPSWQRYQVTTAEIAAQGSEDAGSSFDVSFDVDADSLEEATKA
jgi:hypothetical protein